MVVLAAVVVVAAVVAVVVVVFTMIKKFPSYGRKDLNSTQHH